MSKLEDIELTIWIRPHHNFGFIKTLWVFEEDDIYTTVVREQSDKVRAGIVQNIINEEAAFSEKEVTDFNPKDIDTMLAAIKYDPLIDYDYTKMGGSFFGLRIERGYQKSTFEWHGDMGTFSPAIVNLYEYVYNL